MASNPYFNKVVYDGQTLMDLTADDVAAADVLAGKKFHDGSGAVLTGTYDPTSIIDDTAGTGDTDRTWSADKLSNAFMKLSESGTIAKASSKTLPFQAECSYLVFTTGGTDARLSATLVFKSSNNTLFQSICKGNDITITRDASGLTITNGNANYAIRYFVYQL